MRATLGRPIAEEAPGYPAPASALGYGQIVTPLSQIFTVAPLMQYQQVDVSSGPWESVNDPLALPFMLDRTETVFQLGWRNGSSAALTNADLGIYSAAWVRLVSTGSTLIANSSVIQWVDVADTVLQPRTLYYLAGAWDQVTANRVSRWAIASTRGMALAGVQSSATDAFPLPDPLTNMADVAVFTQVPVWLMAFRSLV